METLPDETKVTRDRSEEEQAQEQFEVCSTPFHCFMLSACSAGSHLLPPPSSPPSSPHSSPSSVLFIFSLLFVFSSSPLLLQNERHAAVDRRVSELQREYELNSHKFEAKNSSNNNSARGGRPGAFVVPRATKQKRMCKSRLFLYFCSLSCFSSCVLCSLVSQW